MNKKNTVTSWVPYFSYERRKNNCVQQLCHCSPQQLFTIFPQNLLTEPESARTSQMYGVKTSTKQVTAVHLCNSSFLSQLNQPLWQRVIYCLLKSHNTRLNNEIKGQSEWWQIFIDSLHYRLCWSPLTVLPGACLKLALISHVRIGWLEQWRNY